MSSKIAPRPITHVGLTVPDINAGIEWYQDVLGFELLKGPVTVQGHEADIATEIVGAFEEMTQAHLGSGNQVGLELFTFTGTAGNTETAYQSSGLSHFCVIDPNIEGLIDRIVSNGGTQHSPIRTYYPGTEYRLAYCRDPFENYIEIFTHSYEQFMANTE